MLAVNAGKPKGERLTRIRIFEELRARGYDGGQVDLSRAECYLSGVEAVSPRMACGEKPALHHVRGTLPIGVRKGARAQHSAQSRDLRQHEDRGGLDLRRPRSRLQSPVPADVRTLPGRSRRLHPRLGLEEGTGREPGRRRPAAVLRAATEV